MNHRRIFLKSALALAAGVSLWGGSAAADSGPFPSGVVYTAEDPGMWAAKVAIHLPLVSVEGETVTLRTDHPMSPDHFIVRHTVVRADGVVVGFQVFTPESSPVSTHTIAQKGEYYATSFCNLHDLWVAKFIV
ncbi:MAG: desulfoferrodoxin family protein [Pseudomonadota bacterium]